MIFLFYRKDLNNYNETTKELKSNFTIEQYNNSDILKQYLTINNNNEVVYNITDKLQTNEAFKYTEDYFDNFLDKYKKLSNFKDSLFIREYISEDTLQIYYKTGIIKYQSIVSYLNKFINSKINICNYYDNISNEIHISLVFLNINNILIDVPYKSKLNILLCKIDNTNISNLIISINNITKEIPLVINNSYITQEIENYFINNNFICIVANNTNLKKIKTNINNFGIYKENYNLEYFILDNIEYNVKDPDSINLIMEKAEESLIQKQLTIEYNLYLIFI